MKKIEDLKKEIKKLTENLNVIKDNIDKIAIIISHRLSLTVGADRIYMLEQGEVVEYGSHKELLSQGGAYADMYMKQAENYLAGEVSYGK